MLTVPLQLSDADVVFYPSLLDEQESDRKSGWCGFLLHIIR
jgi:hypothetical protein